ncbi:MAG: permease-like cell division protein FtsX [Clostridia bacterium]|nr:permease-like cell division protein FtsX [Clostridia bacterium]
MNIEKECNIVNDLLFSYSDNVLSNDSKEFVENHLKNCEKCNKKLNEINSEKDNNNQIHEIDYLKGIKKKVKNKNAIIIIIGILLVSVIILNIIIYTNYKNSLGNIKVYLEKNITEEQMNNIQKIIKNIDSNAEITYYSRTDAFNEVKENFGEKGEFLKGYNEENSPLSAYYEIKTSYKLASKMKSMLLSTSGIKSVNNNTNWNIFMNSMKQIKFEGTINESTYQYIIEYYGDYNYFSSIIIGNKDKKEQDEYIEWFLKFTDKYTDAKKLIQDLKDYHENNGGTWKEI